MKNYISLLIGCFVFGCSKSNHSYMLRKESTSITTGDGCKETLYDASRPNNHFGKQIFVRSIDGRSIVFDLYPNTTLADLQNKIFDITSIKPSMQLISYQNKILNKKYAFLYEYVSCKDAVLDFCEKIKGGTELDLTKNFADLRKKGEVVKFSTVAPKWRIIRPGFNLEGKCMNSKCEANGEFVWCNLGFDYGNDGWGERRNCFEIKEIATEAICPICRALLKYSTIRSAGFYLCRYKFNGKIYNIETGEYISPKPEEKEGKTFDKDSFLYFNGKGNLYKCWAFLEISVYTE